MVSAAGPRIVPHSLTESGTNKTQALCRILNHMYLCRREFGNDALHSVQRTSRSLLRSMLPLPWPSTGQSLSSLPQTMPSRDSCRPICSNSSYCTYRINNTEKIICSIYPRILARFVVYQSIIRSVSNLEPENHIRRDL